MIWEPGCTVECVLCGHVRGGDNPPSSWQRHYRTATRRIPIYGTQYGNGLDMYNRPLGYMEYKRI